MAKHKIREIIGIIAFTIINIAIAYVITTALGIKDIVLYQSYTAIQNVVTFETIIIVALSFVESLIYHYKYER
ncbi:MAG: hypothetical protein K6B70_05140 [Clostridia bacterium]|nr:hypothetical protein [Clostridia bacterium]